MLELKVCVLAAVERCGLPPPGSTACPSSASLSQRYRRPMWYYELRHASCQQFVYGGCQGNANMFNTKDQCESICSSRGEGVVLILGYLDISQHANRALEELWCCDILVTA